MPGKSLAIIGATGSGKSTITKLLTKLYSGYSGTILLDGEDIKNLDGESLRSRIAIVPQDISLFDGTILFNISLGNPHLSFDSIKQAAEIVGADKFINQLPGQYDFKIKEGGANLSVGQRQLLAFARALAKNPDLIVLDEATSSIDPESERVIERGIEVLSKQCTTVVVAHRLSTIRRCDFVLALHKGRILEWGSQDNLRRKEGSYLNQLKVAQY